MTQTQKQTELIAARFGDEPGSLTLHVDDEQPDVVLDAAADIGNARSLFLLRIGEQTRQVTMPAVRTLHGASSFDLFVRRGHGADSWHTLAADEHIIGRDGIERFLGRLATAQDRLAASSGRGSDKRYEDGTITDFVLASAAAALPRATQIALRLVVVVPISLWPLVHERVAAALKGSYTYRYNGREPTVKIAQVFVRRECEVAYGALPPRAGRGLILDGGGRTVNVALFADGEYRAGATIDNLGVEAALDAVDKDLLRGGCAPLSLRERDELLAALREGSQYSIRRNAVAFRIDQTARRQFDAAARALVQELHAKVRVESAEWIQFIGGAAYFFGDTVRELLPIVEIVREPELINARGALASLGVSVKKGRRR